MEISAKQVMQLRKATGLGMMDCKKALKETEGDFEKAQELLRKKLGKAAEKKAGRETGEALVRARFSDDRKSGTMIIMLCESEPVSKTPMFREFVDQVADVVHAAGAADVDSALTLAWEGEDGDTLGEALKSMIGRIGENMRLGKVTHLDVDGDGFVGGYVHFNEKEGALVALTGKNDLEEQARELGMHIVFAKPVARVRDEIDAAEVEKELKFLREQIAEDPKMKDRPEAALENILKGRLDKNFYGQRVLTEQGWYRDGGSTKVQTHLDEWGAALKDFGLFHVGV